MKHYIRLFLCPQIQQHLGFSGHEVEEIIMHDVDMIIGKISAQESYILDGMYLLAFWPAARAATSPGALPPIAQIFAGAPHHSLRLHRLRPSGVAKQVRSMAPRAEE